VKPSRSLLFVSGQKESWVPKAVTAGTDAVILDLEDSVPSAHKESARDCVKRSVEWLRSQAPAVSVYVRPNALETGLTGFDLQSVVQAGLDGLILPKVDGPRDIMHAEALVDHFELVNGVLLNRRT
jgi:citrate lyase subunit beta/citryl-CoA lyase